MPRTLLSYVLSRLERLESPLLRHRDIDVYPEKDIKTLVRQGVLVAASPAESVLLRTRPHVGRFVVVRQTPRGWYGVDEDDVYFSPVPLAEEDIRQYTVSVPALVALVRHQNDIDGHGCTAEYGIIPIGRRHVDGIGKFEVYLSLANYDADTFVARCRHLSRPIGTVKTVLLVPRTVALSPTLHNAIEGAGIVVVQLWHAAQKGSLSVDWCSLAAGGTVRNAFVSPRKIIYRGHEYPCDLTTMETAFLTASLEADEIDVHRIMHGGKAAVIKGHYQRSTKQRNRVHQLLTRVNTKLVDAGVPLSFSLPRGRDTIVRESSPTRVAAP